MSCINVGEALICKGWRLLSEAALEVVRSGGLGVGMHSGSAVARRAEEGEGSAIDYMCVCEKGAAVGAVV